MGEGGGGRACLVGCTLAPELFDDLQQGVGRQRQHGRMSCASPQPELRDALPASHASVARTRVWERGLECQCARTFSQSSTTTDRVSCGSECVRSRVRVRACVCVCACACARPSPCPGPCQGWRIYREELGSVSHVMCCSRTEHLARRIGKRTCLCWGVGGVCRTRESLLRLPRVP